MASDPAQMPAHSHDATALWIEAAGRAVLRPQRVTPGPGDLVVRALFSGISRGTERLVFEGRVPASEHGRMRAPLQEGDFPFPVKYGYAAVGEVIAGPKERIGQIVFALHPHQSVFACPEAMAQPVPHAVPPGRAILAANMETALNIVWDAGIGPGDRVAVVGAGVVGLLAGWVAARVAGTEVTLIDRLERRASLARLLGCRFATPDGALDAASGCDAVIHTSASAAGLATALSLAGPEAVVAEASWFGTGETPVPLGGAFHSQRLRLVSSQVGRIPASRVPRWSFARRMGVALGFLSDPVLDALIDGETPLADLPYRYGDIVSGIGTLCHRIRFD